MTPKSNPMQRNSPPNPVQNLPSNPDSDPGLSYSSSSDSSDSSDYGYTKLGRHMKKNKNKSQSKNLFNDPIKKCKNVTFKILKYVYNLKVIKFKLDEDPLQRRFYYLYFLEYLKIDLSPFQ